MTAREAIDALTADRMLLVDAELEPVGAPTIQLTTFANTGPSFYVDAGGELSAVVDSVASMANQLEATVWDADAGRPSPPVAALPWVQVVDSEGQPYTTSRTAAHRLNAHSIVEGKLEADGVQFEAKLKERLGAQPTPPLAAALGDVVWELDPLALVHGVWFPGIWDGRARAARALSGRIDAHGVQTQSVQVGGQKTADAIVETGVGQRGAEGKTVAGEIPHHTSEVSASRIVGRLMLDVRLLRSYALDETSEQALVAAALLELVELVADWPRRRSRCALDVASVTVRRPAGWVGLPPLDELRETCHAICTSAVGTESSEPLTVRFDPATLSKQRKADA